MLPLVASAAAIALLANDDIPLGKLGEWVWNRSGAPPGPARWALPLAALAGYGGFVIWGSRRLERDARWRAAALVPGLMVAAAVLQATWTRMPREGLGQERWPASLYFPATSGYLAAARAIDDPGLFLANYAEWIAAQDNFHIGTHPPGLILLHKWLLDFFARHPRAADRMIGLTSSRFAEGLAEIAATNRPPLAEQATLAALALLTWGASLSTTGLIYLVARTGASRPAAWLAAAHWPITVAAIGFLPLSDCLYPALALAVVALAIVRTSGWRAVAAAALAGLFLWLGMTLSLAFLAAIPIALGARLLTGDAGRSTLASVAAFLLAFLFATLAAWWWLDLNLPAAWRVNLAKHAGFYERMPRSYAFWTFVNLVEFAIAAGPVSMTLALLGAVARGARSRRDPLWIVTGCWLATIVALDLSGRNLSEVARLWVFLAPFASCAAARAIDLAQPFHWRWGTLLAAQGLVTLVALARVEPLLPIRVLAP